MSAGFPIERFAFTSLASWNAPKRDGGLERIYLHWSGGDYSTVYDAYHLCVALHSGGIVVVETRDVGENLRDVGRDPGRPYGAHVLGRNSFAAGVAVMAMKDARPDDFGPYPLTGALLDALCSVTARMLRTYELAVTPQTVATHAEAAVEDGYFGADPVEERWDIARLQPSREPLSAGEARTTGDELRARIGALR